MRSFLLCALAATASLLTSCGSYRHNVLFEVDPASAGQQARDTEGNYTIAPNDLLTLEVYTNHGEKLVDPNRESFKEGTTVSANPTRPQYLVDVEGVAQFPLVGPMKLSGLTLREAEGALNEAYEKFYEGAHVVLSFNNKRVIVLGAPGGQVIPLNNENMRLAEVIALAKGIPEDGRGDNIRVIREEKVMLADFSTFEGYRKTNFIMKPGDIVYVEPVRRPLREALRDYSPIVSIVTGLATLLFIIFEADNP